MTVSDSAPAPAINDELSAGLDADQAAAVAAFGPRTLVIAGAGSGKTRVLTYGLAHLIVDHGISDEQLMLLTFTRRAALEMRERAEALLGRELDDLHCGTFHAVAATLLRRHGEREFTVIDEQEALLLVAELLTAAVDSDNAAQVGVPDPTQLAEIFSRATESGRDIAGVLGDYAHGGFISVRRLVDELYDAYTERKRQLDAFDYADVLAEFLTFIDSEAGQVLRRRLRAVLVDEAQDLNALQRRIVDALCRDGAWQVQVGDPQQSIYGFRDADYQALFELSERPDAVVAKLPVNYRSFYEIVHAAQALVPQSQLGLDIVAERGRCGVLPKLLDPPTPDDEAQLIARWAQQHVDAGADPCDLAVLARQHVHLSSARLALASIGLPTVDLGRSPAGRDREDARAALIAFMRLAENRFDRLGWQRLVGLVGFDAAQQQDWLQRLERFDDPFAQLRDRIEHPLLDEMLDLIAAGRASADLWQRLCHGPYGMMLADLVADSNRRAGLLLWLLDSVAAFEQEGQLFLDAVISGGAGDLDTQAGAGLATVHGVKGLEWKHIFVARVSVGAFPSARADAAELAEERRLLYVAMTRARDTLTVSRAPWLRERFQALADRDFFADALLRERFSVTG